MADSFLNQFMHAISATVMHQLSWQYIDRFPWTTMNLDDKSQELVYKVEHNLISFDGPYDQNYVDYNNILNESLDRIIGYDQEGKPLTETVKNLGNQLKRSYISDQLYLVRQGFIQWRTNLIGKPAAMIKNDLASFELSVELSKQELKTYAHIASYHNRIEEFLSTLLADTSQVTAVLKNRTEISTTNSMREPLPKIVILTALLEEYTSVLEHLADISEESFDDSHYERGLFRYEDQDIADVIIRECGQHNDVAAQETQRAIEHFSPEAIFFVGIAGSRKPNDFKVGDVIIAEKVYNYEGGKAQDVGFLARPDQRGSSYSVVEAAKSIRRKAKWKALIKGMADTSSIKADVGIIASGEKLIEHYDSGIGQILSLHYNDTQAVEMEGFGFAKAAGRQGRKNSQILIGVIRGISDILKENVPSDRHSEAGNNEQTDKRPSDVKLFASRSAAAFTFSLVEKLFADFKKKAQSVPKRPDF